MPSFPIIDTHLHLWNPDRIVYSWQKGNDLLNRPYEVDDYREATTGIQVEAMVFVECHGDDEPFPGQYIREMEFAEEQAKHDPRIGAFVAKAPLERGVAVIPILDELKTRFPKLRGIRRIPEFEPDPLGFMLDPQFVEGVRLLKKYQLHFELNVNYSQMDDALQLLELVSDVPVVLDHCGKPGVRGGHINAFRRHMRAFAMHSNVMCKLSDLPVEADWKTWTAAELQPFIDATVEAFGFERVMFGGDWPVCLQATSLARWVAVVDKALMPSSDMELRLLYRDNANRFYRLGL